MERESMKRLSFIIPVYNVEPFLARCLDSILSQIPDNSEIICVNDGSKDNSLSILRDYERRYKDIVFVIDQENKGVAVARNRGIEAAKGELIMFTDPDDYYLDGAIPAAIKEYKRKGNPDWMLFGYKSGGENTKHSTNCPKPFDYSKEERYKVLLFVDIMIFGVPWNKIFRRDVIERNNVRFSLGVKYHDDETFNLDYLLACNTISTCALSIYCWWCNENSITYTTPSEDRFYCLKRVIDLKDKAFRKLTINGEGGKKAQKEYNKVKSKRIIPEMYGTIKRLYYTNAINKYTEGYDIIVFIKKVTNVNFKIASKYITISVARSLTDCPRIMNIYLYVVFKIKLFWHRVHGRKR